MCSSTCARAKVYFKPWQQSGILWKTSWKLALLLVQQGSVKKHVVSLCLDTWLAFALAAVLESGLLCLAELIPGTPSPLPFPTNPRTRGCTRWDSSEGSHTFLVHTVTGTSRREGRSSSGIPNPWRSTRIPALTAKRLHSVPLVVQAAPGVLI